MPYATPALWPRANSQGLQIAATTLVAWAELLGLDDAMELLNETLAQEKKADELLTSIAENGVNEAAAERPQAAAE